MTPTVSICMPNYNFARYLPEAIESALRQSYTDFEFIIIDNCSTDNSVDIIKYYAERDSRIRFSVNDRNIGPVNNMNLCLQQAQGEYVKFLFSDDLFVTDNALQWMVTILAEHDVISLVASARHVIDDQSNIIKTWSEYKGEIGYAGTKIIQDCLIEQKNKIGEPSVVLFRKKYAARGFDIRYKQAVDLEMWLHLLEQGDFAYISEPLCAFRQHLQQQTKVNIDDINFGTVEEPFLLLQNYAGKPYIKLPWLIREYMQYVPVFAIWKLYKKEKITRQGAIKKVREHYSWPKFIFYYPLFRFYKFIGRMKEVVFVAAASFFSIVRH